MRTLGIRPERVAVSAAAVSGRLNEFPGTVTSASYLGADLELTVQCAGTPLRARVPAAAPGRNSLTPGAPVFVHLPPDALMLLED